MGPRTHRQRYGNALSSFTDSTAARSKVLSIKQAVYLVVDQQVAHWLCQAAYAKTHADISFLHDLSQGNGGCDRRTAYTGLVRESVLEIWAVYYELGTVISHHQLSHIRSCLLRR